MSYGPKLALRGVPDVYNRGHPRTLPSTGQGSMALFCTPAPAQHLQRCRAAQPYPKISLSTMTKMLQIISGIVSRNRTA